MRLWFFCVRFRPVKLKPLKRVPVLLAAGVILAACAAQIARPKLVEKLEWDTYDWRVRLAAHFPAPAATNLGFVAISDDSIAALNNGSLGYRYGLYWPRHIYGRITMNRAGTRYEGRCPKCNAAISAIVGPDGTRRRIFEAE